MSPALNLEEILRLHEQCQTVWRQNYDTIRELSDQFYRTRLTKFLALPTFPLPNNIQIWKDRYKQAMQDMKPLVMGMGLYLHMRRDKKEMIDIIHKVSLAIPS